MSETYKRFMNNLRNITESKTTRKHKAKSLKESKAPNVPAYTIKTELDKVLQGAFNEMYKVLIETEYPISELEFGAGWVAIPINSDIIEDEKDFADELLNVANDYIYNTLGDDTSVEEEIDGQAFSVTIGTEYKNGYVSLYLS